MRTVINWIDAKDAMPKIGKQVLCHLVDDKNGIRTIETAILSEDSHGELWLETVFNSGFPNSFPARLCRHWVYISGVKNDLF